MIVQIKKLKEVPDPTHPNNIEVGFEKEVNINPATFDPPELDKRFWLSMWSTSLVQEVIDDHTFRTLNSVYEWHILEPPTPTDNMS